MSKTRTPFDILGVSPSDDMTTIRMAWRAKVRLLHPDHADDRKTATAKLAAVNAAFDALQGHAPCKKVKAAGAAKRARDAAELIARAKRAARRRAEARQAAERASEEARRHREALALADAKKRAAKKRLMAQVGTINAKAAHGYAEARKVVSRLQ